MKKQILCMVGLLAATLVSCNDNTIQKTATEPTAVSATQKESTEAFAELSFTKNEHDFGVINEGDVVDYKFTYTNTGKAPLVILNARGSCGCTVSQWSKKPIAPGEKGHMLVTFNSNGKPNQQNKQVTITANTQKGKEILKIKAMVTPKVRNAKSGSPISK